MLHESNRQLDSSAVYDEQFRYAFAVEYRDRGYSVIPLVGKKPALASWKEFQGRRASHGEIAVWFGEASRLRGVVNNVGIITGAVSGLVVIDCDSKADTKHWLENFPESPLMVETGSGGLHVYYQLPEDARVTNRIRVFGRAIDVRGEGGYVVAPPSRHPNGSLYRWVSWGSYSLSDVPVFNPDWVQDARDQVLSPRLNQRLPTKNPWSISSVRRRIERIQSISGSGGHSDCFHVACILFEAGLSQADALTEILRWNETNAHPAWTLKELQHKLHDAHKKVTAR